MNKAIILSCLLFCACDKAIEPTKMCETDNPDYHRVALLFEVDGIKVYRFYDWGRARYFASNGSVSGGYTTSHYNHSTKSTSHHFHPEEISTVDK